MACVVLLCVKWNHFPIVHLCEWVRGRSEPIPTGCLSPQCDRSTELRGEIHQKHCCANGLIPPEHLRETRGHCFTHHPTTINPEQKHRARDATIVNPQSVKNRMLGWFWGLGLYLWTNIVPGTALMLSEWWPHVCEPHKKVFFLSFVCVSFLLYKQTASKWKVGPDAALSVRWVDE
jgi:hypothetical protein